MTAVITQRCGGMAQLLRQTIASAASIRTLQQAFVNSTHPNLLNHENVFSSPRISHEWAFELGVRGVGSSKSMRIFREFFARR